MASVALRSRSEAIHNEDNSIPFSLRLLRVFHLSSDVLIHQFHYLVGAAAQVPSGLRQPPEAVLWRADVIGLYRVQGLRAASRPRV